uniref:(California timema) hypothetical protein n=1 Tax=Timema californicum TaxID=61474 RepID=A0A7R9JLE8_TIMCA|nr:unnamed protein product [Timema californicum]
MLVSFVLCVTDSVKAGRHVLISGIFCSYYLNERRETPHGAYLSGVPPQVFSWGEGEDGKLGHNNRLSVDKPCLVEAFKSKRVRDIACGSNHSAAITSSGELYTWGLGEYGRLGHGDNITQLKPKLVSNLDSQEVPGADYTCQEVPGAVYTSQKVPGAVYTSQEVQGAVYTSQEVPGADYTRVRRSQVQSTLVRRSQVQTTPESGGGPKFDVCVFQVKGLLGVRVVQVACGSRDAQTLALSDEGMVFSWGDGDFGKLGRGGSDGCSTPHNVERLNNMGVCQIECGAQFSLALTRSGQVSGQGVSGVTHPSWARPDRQCLGGQGLNPCSVN